MTNYTERALVDLLSLVVAFTAGAFAGATIVSERIPKPAACSLCVCEPGATPVDGTGTGSVSAPVGTVK